MCRTCITRKDLFKVTLVTSDLRWRELIFVTSISEPLLAANSSRAGISRAFPFRGKISVGTLRINAIRMEESETKERLVSAAEPNLDGVHIVVKTLNGINWDEFMQSIYRKDGLTTINGEFRVNESRF